MPILDCFTTNTRSSNLVWNSRTGDSGTSTNQVWPQWTIAADSANTVTTGQNGETWVTWTNGTWHELQTRTLPGRTEEDIQAWRQREQERQEKAGREARELQEAEQRAEALLHEHLSPEQIDMLERMREFLIVGSKGSPYLIQRGRAQNVFALDRIGRKIMQLCAHPSEFVPDPDTMLAQKLMLEADEDEFLRVANAVQLA